MRDKLFLFYIMYEFETHTLTKEIERNKEKLRFKHVR